MTNQLILTPQKFNFDDLLNQFPAGKLKKKIFFQSELRSLANGNATFGVIAYPGWKETRKKWKIGIKISGSDTGVVVTKPFSPPLAFANNELLMALGFNKKIKKKKKAKSYKAKKNELLRLVKKINQSRTLREKSFFLFNAGISENPHLEYDVTLDMGGETFSMRTNPSPPAKPLD